MKCASYYKNDGCLRWTSGSTSRLHANGRRKSKPALGLGGLPPNSQPAKRANNKVGFAMFCLVHAALGYRYGRRNNKGENLTDEFYKPAALLP